MTQKPLSKSEVARLIKQGAIDIDGEPSPKDPNAIMEVYSIFKIGKKTYKKVVFSQKKLKDIIYEITQ